jgi:nitroreductase/dihydropteridine reductase
MSTSFLNHLEWRHATKAFDKTKAVSDDHLEKILQAIRMAPTSFGLQPFHVEVIKDQTLREKLLPHAWNQKQVITCSALLVFVARTNLEGRITGYIDTASGGNAEIKAKMQDYEKIMRSTFNGRTQDELKAWAQKQAYIALGFGLAACAELQIDSCPMEGLVGPEFDKILGLEKDHFSSVMLAIGYRDPAVHSLPKVRFPEKDLFHRK